ncbi:hypothetical protein [Oscillatoria salina]|uniref:hypothetical protein n=1 Tax=Oscillatoria salina TaxID=331517 RepID=UPI0013B69C7B|nr:hypothetical protein [Oscillatoria salina]MBZ8182576.1 hypothetical protein [Oscillatoria salina IIICB1]NET90023.1 hypothetical protein [Kamptonema sp. SIO1D9]
MNFSVNRFSESPQPPGDQTPEEGNNSREHQSATTDNSEKTTKNTNDRPEASASENNPAPSSRKQPIPPPTEPRQYRAIGLVKGKYQPSEEQWTRGNVITSDDTSLDAVLLGRTIGLLKNHLDLDEPHLWVVYPRTRQNESEMHVQIVGVWEPETLDRHEESDPASQPSDSSAEAAEAAPTIEDGYFSIRGEVIFHSREAEKVVVKIRQSPKPREEKGKFFKLELKGSLPSERAVGHFWDLEVRLQGNTLIVEQATDIGPLFSRKKKNFRKKGKKYPPKGKGKGRPNKKPESGSSTSSTPKPKPTLKGKKSPPKKTDN